MAKKQRKNGRTKKQDLKRDSERRGRETARKLREFNEQEELDAIRRRYQAARETLAFTVPRLRRSRDFLETYGRLVASGWKDWHVLLAIANIVNNYRARVRGDQPHTEGDTEWLERFRKAFFEKETEEDPRPHPEEFTYEKMRFALDLAIVAGLRGRGWVMKNPTPNFAGLRKFAAERYRYLELDVDHEPFFRGVE